MFDKYRSTALGILLAALFFHISANDCTAQSQTGTLTGTITTADNRPVNADSGLVATGVFIDLQEHARASSYNPGDFRTRGVFNDTANGRSRVSSDLSLNGLYTFRNLRPGVYDLVVEGGMLPDSPSGWYVFYRPQRIVGVVVRPGQETVFDITVHAGARVQQNVDPKNNTLEMVGEPKGNTLDGLKWGWIEGTVTNPDGQPVWSARALLVAGVAITLRKTTGEQSTFPTDHLAGGFFAAYDMKPGMYDVILEKGSRYKNFYRPQIIGQVMIKPGVRTVLKVTMNPGDTLERVGEPQVVGTKHNRRREVGGKCGILRNAALPHFRNEIPENFADNCSFSFRLRLYRMLQAGDEFGAADAYQNGRRARVSVRGPRTSLSRRVAFHRCCYARGHPPRQRPEGAGNTERCRCRYRRNRPRFQLYRRPARPRRPGPRL